MKLRQRFILTTTTLLISALSFSNALAVMIPVQPKTEPTITPAKPSTPRTPRFLSIVFSPAFHTLPIYEVIAEYRSTSNTSVALVGGYGSITKTISSDDYKFPIWDLGIQARYYILGDFSHGMQVGIDARYVHVSNETYNHEFHREPVAAFGTRFDGGPFIGYKIATNLGFTFETQFGTLFPFIREETPERYTNSPFLAMTPNDDTIHTYLKFNFGWSF